MKREFPLDAAQVEWLKKFNRGFRELYKSTLNVVVAEAGSASSSTVEQALYKGQTVGQHHPRVPTL